MPIKAAVSEDFILNLTPTGMVPTKRMTPHVPTSISEIVDDVLACADMGMTIVHIHARDGDEPDWHAETYGAIIEGIRKSRSDLVLCVSLSGRRFSDFEKRADPILKLDGAAKPDMASLTLSSMNFAHEASVNHPGMVVRLAETMLDRGIVPELEVFDVGMANFACHLATKDLLPGPRYANLFLGNIAGAQARMLDAAAMVAALPLDTTFSFGGIGDHQLAANVMGLLHADGVRVGLEDSIWMDSGRTALASNLKLVNRVRRIASDLGRHPMAPYMFRNIMGMEHGGFGGYGRRA